MTSSRWGERGQVKHGQNPDARGGLGGGGEGIRRNWMSRAIIRISVISVETVFQTGVWFCYKCCKQVSGSVLDSILILFLAFQLRCVCLSYT